MKASEAVRRRVSDAMLKEWWQINYDITAVAWQHIIWLDRRLRTVVTIMIILQDKGCVLALCFSK